MGVYVCTIIMSVLCDGKTKILSCLDMFGQGLSCEIWFKALGHHTLA